MFLGGMVTIPNHGWLDWHCLTQPTQNVSSASSGPSSGSIAPARVVPIGYVKIVSPKKIQQV